MSANDQTSANNMWGGRFSGGPDEVMERINASIDVDRRLYAQDIAASKAHCKMLMDQSIINPTDGNSILEGLDRIHKEIASGDFDFKPALEDVHMNIESRLADLIGDAAGRLHTARSRNDQVATDLRLWVRDAIDATDAALVGLQSVLIDRAETEADTAMPGFTHLQSAQPVTFGHHLLAYVEMFGRDRGRFHDCRVRLNESPLGAAALAGTAFPIDRDATAKALDFDAPMANSLDAVSARDFVLEFLAATAICGVHASRLAEEIVLWCTQQFDFVRLGDRFTTGSSIMPQKRNPDAAELVRAKAGRIMGSLVSLLAVMKGLPLAYCKDMQEDKPPTFDAADSLGLVIAALTGMVGDLDVQRDAMRSALDHGYPTATDLADWLVRCNDMPFRKAHQVTGRIVAAAEKLNCVLADLPLEVMREIEPSISEDVFSVLSVDASLASRTSLGGTAPERVREAVKAARRRYL
jgi:argininosuccinate lyase